MNYLIKKVRENGLILIGILAGALAGFLYWHFVGCLDGTCPLNASPLMNVIRGGIVGGLVFALIDSIRKNNNY